MISLRLVTFCLFVIACLDFSGCQPNYCLPLQPLLQEIQTNGIGTTGECRCNTSDEFKRLQKEVVQLQNIVKSLVRVAKNLNYVDYCGVGIKDGRIPDRAMTASSVSRGRGGNLARLDSNRFWHPYWPPSEFVGEWVQVDLGKPTHMVGIVTQGRPSGANQYITRYTIAYGNSTSTFNTIQRRTGGDLVFQGNVDRNNYKINMFPEPIVAQIFRIVAVAYHGAPILRIEYLVC